MTSTVQRGTLAISPEPADLVRLVRRVMENFADQGTGAGCTLQLVTPDLLPEVWNEFRIEQMRVEASRGQVTVTVASTTGSLR